MMLLERLFQGHRPQLIMFDLDGTLVDSVPDLTVAVDYMLTQLGRPIVGTEQVRHWVGNGVSMLVRRALSGQMTPPPLDDTEVAHALSLFMAAYGEGHGQTRPYPGVLPVLRLLQSWQMGLALITNKPEQFIGPLLDGIGLAGVFQWIVGGDTLPQQKPDPAGLRHVMTLAGVSPSQALFIGDSCNDIRAAKAAGVRSIAMSYGYNHGRPIAEEAPDGVLDDLRELLLAG